MNKLTDLPNIGKVLADKLNTIGIKTKQELVKLGSENAILKIETIEQGAACINMLYALEGAIQGIGWHGLDDGRKEELKIFFKMMKQTCEI